MDNEYSNNPSGVNTNFESSPPQRKQGEKLTLKPFDIKKSKAQMGPPR